MALTPDATSGLLQQHLMNMDLEKMEGMSASVLILHAMGGHLQHSLGKTTFVILVFHSDFTQSIGNFLIPPLSGMELGVALTALAVCLIAPHGSTKSCPPPPVTP